MAVAGGPNIVEDGLVLCLDAGNTKSYPGSGTTWTDLMRGSSMSLQNGSIYNSGNGGYIKFDGTNDYGVINQPPTYYGMTSTHTWCAWFRITSNTDAFDHIWGSLGFNSGIGFNTSNRLRASWHYGADYNSANAAIMSSDIQLNRWYCANAVIDNVSGFLKLYLDGAEVASTTFSPMTNMWDGYVRMAGGDYSNSPADVAYASAYNRVLSASEITQNFNATRGRFGI